MAKTFSIKIADGIRIITSKEIVTIEGFSMPKVWEYFGWDIENNADQDASATEITRALMMFGRVDLTEYVKPRKTLIIEVIPVGELNKD